MRLFALACLALLVSGAAQANVISNGTFDSPTAGVQVGSAQSGTGWSYVSQASTVTNSDWTWSGNAGVINASTGTKWFHSSPPSGSSTTQYGFLQLAGSSISQSFTLTWASTVTITWSSAGRPLGQTSGGDTTYSVTAGSLTSSYTTTTGSNFVTYTLSGTLPAGTYTLKYEVTAATGDQTAFLSSVFMTAIPEPPTLAFFASGLAALAFLRRRAAGGPAAHRLA